MQDTCLIRLRNKFQPHLLCRHTSSTSPNQPVWYTFHMSRKYILILIVASCIALMFFLQFQKQNDSEFLETNPLAKPTQSAEDTVEQTTEDVAKETTERCVTDDDCPFPQKCKETTTCPPCSELSPDYPENCQCHSQSNCE